MRRIAMRPYAYLAFIVASVVLLPFFAADTDGQNRFLPLAGACRHDSAATESDRMRRDQALSLARAINQAEGLAAQRTREYQPLAALPNLPQAPPGFRVLLYVDDSGYMFSIKDDRDPCHYGIFSDENGRLYEMSPQVPQNAS
jgi:hypothetical protein